jgi:hypothetical protein
LLLLVLVLLLVVVVLLLLLLLVAVVVVVPTWLLLPDCAELCVAGGSAALLVKVSWLERVVEERGKG